MIPKSSLCGLVALAAAVAVAVLPAPRAAAQQTRQARTAASRVSYYPKALVTWKNAPSPDPGRLDGYFMLYDPLKPSGGPYPVLAPGEKIWIDVSISQQLVYIFHGPRLIYTMATSSGMQNIKGDGSPPGVYQIQRARGKWFYVPSEHVGAEYWVSWHGDGEYLFHSVPMTRDKRIMPYVAADLLHEASWGCFLLTVPDAQWIYNNVPYGTTVIVQTSPVLLRANTIFEPNETQNLAAFLTSLSPGGR